MSIFFLPSFKFILNVFFTWEKFHNQIYKQSVDLNLSETVSANAVVVQLWSGDWQNQCHMEGYWTGRFLGHTLDLLNQHVLG